MRSSASMLSTNGVIPLKLRLLCRPSAVGLQAGAGTLGSTLTLLGWRASLLRRAPPSPWSSRTRATSRLSRRRWSGSYCSRAYACRRCRVDGVDEGG